jgi:hypothetical protein
VNERVQAAHFEERRSTAAKAKQAQLEAARAKSPANDPNFAERQAARRMASEARDLRALERKAQRLAEAKRRETAAAENELARVRALEAAQLAREAEAAAAGARKPLPKSNARHSATPDTLLESPAK